MNPTTDDLRMDAALRRFLGARAEELAADAIDAFAMADRVQVRVGSRPFDRRLVLLVAATLLMAATITTAIAVATGLIPPPWRIHDAELPTSNGWVAFAIDGRAGAALESNGFDPRTGFYGDIYLTGGGLTPHRIIGSDNDGLVQACPAFSPDGTLLAYGEVAQGTTVRTPPPVTSADGPVAELASSTQAAGDAAVVIIGLDRDGNPSGYEQRIAVHARAGDQLSGSDVPCVQWSPDGGSLAYVFGSQLQVAALETGEAAVLGQQPWDGQTNYGSVAFAWSPDGRSIAVMAGPTLRVVPVDGSAPRILVDEVLEDGFDFMSLAWSPDAKSIAVGGSLVTFTPDGGGSSSGAFIRIIAVDGSGETAVDVVGDSVGRTGPSPAWSPDGSRIAFVQGTDVVVTTLDGTDRVTLPLQVPGSSTGPLAPWSAPSWSPDGERLLVVVADTAGSFAAASVPADPALSPAFLTPLTRGFYSGTSLHLSWQGVNR